MARRRAPRSLGFGGLSITYLRKRYDIVRKIQPEDLLALPASPGTGQAYSVLVALEELDEAAFIRILQEPATPG